MTNRLYEDQLYVEPFVDIDEQRDGPIAHRYVHGGFADTDLRFSMYFPTADLYDARFFQPLMHIAGDENVAPTGELAGLGTRSIEFAFASGGYLVESNQGSSLMMGPPDITGFRASAATAQYSRILAAEMYGEHRPHGYVFGGSGGAYKTMACMENTDGVWDGAVPFIHGSHMSMPNVFTVLSHALRVLDGKFDQIADAVAPGGSGDIYLGLNDEERAALEEVTGMGFPPRAWFAHERVALSYTGVFAAIFGTLAMGDPTYFDDFWTVPGYLGADPPESLRGARIQHTATITEIVSTGEVRAMGLPVSITAGTRDSAPAAFRLSDLPTARLQGAFLSPRTGGATGERLMITGAIDGLLMLGFGGLNIEALEAMREGDDVEIDNADYLASQTYHRHQSPGPEYPVWDQFHGADGVPRFPQRPLLEGFDQVGVGNSWQSGRFSCKVITVNCLMDEAAFPWQADWYRKRVQRELGAGIADRYRLWFVDHAMHVNPSRYLSPTEGRDSPEGHGPTDTRIVSYAGILQQALRDVAAWAEKGVAPPAETAYRVDNGQIHLPPGAGERGGVQPVVDLTANGGVRAEIAVGEEVDFVGVASVPRGAGVLVQAEWDYDGSGAFADVEEVDGSSDSVTMRRARRFDAPGTYFVTLRVASQREEAVATPFGKARNLDGVRVIVS
ncbi:MAG: hypothetical protein P8J50_18675 [Acidimicrobiales bacterium]|nr:hypothetical protein [Acidimicrobiales bacterium]